MQGVSRHLLRGFNSQEPRRKPRIGKINLGRLGQALPHIAEPWSQLENDI